MVLVLFIFTSSDPSHADSGQGLTDSSYLRRKHLNLAASQSPMDYLFSAADIVNCIGAAKAVEASINYLRNYDELRSTIARISDVVGELEKLIFEIGQATRASQESIQQVVLRDICIPVAISEHSKKSQWSLGQRHCYFGEGEPAIPEIQLFRSFNM